VLDKAEYSAFESTLNSPIVSYRILRYSNVIPVIPVIPVFVHTPKNTLVLLFGSIYQQFTFLEKSTFNWFFLLKIPLSNTATVYRVVSFNMGHSGVVSLG